MDTFSSLNRNGSTIFRTSLGVGLAVTTVLTGLEIKSKSQFRPLTKEALEEWNKDWKRSWTLGNTERLIFQEIKKNRRSKTNLPFSTQDPNDPKLVRFVKKIRNLFKTTVREVHVFRFIIYGTIVCILTSVILYYNINSKIKGLLMTYIASVVNQITQLETFQTLLRKYKDSKFSTNFPLPMTESDQFELQALEQVESKTRLKQRFALSKLYSLARNLNLSKKNSILFVAMALAYWHVTGQNSLKDFLLFLSFLEKLLGSGNDPEQF